MFFEQDGELESNEDELASNEAYADALDDSTVPEASLMRFRQDPIAPVTTPAGAVPVVTDVNAKAGVTVLKANSGAAAGNAATGITLLSKDGLGTDKACECLGQPACGCGASTQENGVKIIKASPVPADATKLTVIPVQSSTVVQA